MRRRHEGCRLLMAREDKLDLRCPQRLDNVEIFLAWDTKDAVDALVLQRPDQKIGTLGHRFPPFFRLFQMIGPRRREGQSDQRSCLTGIR